jgi:hypothetical protein
MKKIISDHALAIQTVTVTVTVDGAAVPVELQVYETGNGGYFAIDRSWIEQVPADEAVYISSPFDEGYAVQLIDKLSKKHNNLVSGDCDDLLINKVISQIKDDIEKGDCTVLDELLSYLPDHILKNSLPELK